MWWPKRRETNAVVVTPAENAFKLPFVEAYNLDNTLAAIAASVPWGCRLMEMAQRAPGMVAPSSSGGKSSSSRGTRS